MAAIPAAVALLSRLFLGERLGARGSAAIGCVVLGIGLLALAKSPGGAPLPADAALGYALLLGAVFCEASYVVIGKQLAGRLSPRRISALINLWGLALATPLGLWQAWGFDFRAVALPTWLLLAFFAVSAGVVDTDALAHFPHREEVLASFSARTPAGAVLTPDDVAGAVYLLCLPEAAMINGASLVVDGGFAISG